MSYINDMIEALDSTRIGDLRSELKNLQAIKAWSIGQLGLDCQPGDRVTIVSEQPSSTGRGWAAYSEALALGQTGIAGEITFNEYANRWQVDVGLDRCWSTHDDRRYWKGPAELTPEGFIPPDDYDQKTWPNGRVKHFSMDVSWVRKAQEAGE